jgi:hypothetical protein
MGATQQQSVARPEITEDYLGRILAPLLSLNTQPPMSGDARDRLSPLQRSYLDEAVMRLWKDLSPALTELKELRQERADGFSKAVAEARSERFRQCDADPRIFVRRLRELDPEDPGELSDLGFQLTEGTATEILAEREKRAADRASDTARTSASEAAAEIVELMADGSDVAAMRETDETKIIAHREAEDRLREAARRIRAHSESV